MKRKHFYTFIPSELFVAAEAVVDSTTYDFDLMKALIGGYVPPICNNLDDAIEYFENLVPPSKGKYTFIRFFVDSQARLMCGTVAAATGGTNTKPINVTISEFFEKEKK
jgi:hypothetical protein